MLLLNDAKNTNLIENTDEKGNITFIKNGIVVAYYCKVANWLWKRYDYDYL